MYQHHVIAKKLLRNSARKLVFVEMAANTKELDLICDMLQKLKETEKYSQMLSMF